MRWIQGLPRKTYLAAALAASAVSILIAVALLWRSDDLRAAYARWRYPRIVLVTFDTLSVGFTGPYNPEVDYTPHLSALGSQGVVFRRAYTTVPITLPAHASLMSGRLPAEMGVMANGDQVQEWIDTLPEILRRQEYRTAAFTSLGVLEREFRLDQGFDFYDRSWPPDGNRWYRNADEVIESASRWIIEAKDNPFLVWVHLSDPHEPYLLPTAPPDVELAIDEQPIGQWNLTSKERHVVTLRLPPGDHELQWKSMRLPRDDDGPNTSLRLSFFGAEEIGKYVSGRHENLEGEFDLRQPLVLSLRNPLETEVSLRLGFTGRIANPPHSEVWENYALEVEYADRYFGKLRELFESLGLEDGTLWIVASDHGEGLFRHGALGHAAFSYEDQLRILWIMKGPGVPKGTIVEDNFVLIEDILPTVLDLLHLQPPADLAGASQTSCWRRKGCYQRQEWWAYGLEHDATGVARISALAAYRPPFKITWRVKGSPKFYNLADDPWETNDLGADSRRGRPAVPPELQRLARRLGDQRQYFDSQLERRSWQPLDAEREALLRSLGYLGN